MQPWYADDLALLRRLAANTHCLKLLTKAGPFFGYYPNPGKSGMSATRRMRTMRAAFDAAGIDIQFTCRQQYVGRFIGSDATRQ
ncbi:hypothetical protein ACHAXS_001950 [Conticribra weissflogii]